MDALKQETRQPEPGGGVGYASAGRLSAASGARGPGDELRADLLTESRTRGSLGYSDRDCAEGRLQSLVPFQDNEEPRLAERMFSGPTVPDDAVSADSTPAFAGTPAPAPVSGGSPGDGEGPEGSWGTARLRCAPGREQVQLCELGSVKNGWLPVHKRALLFGVPLHVRNSENLPSRVRHLLTAAKH